jgi:hypothetical protein
VKIRYSEKHFEKMFEIDRENPVFLRKRNTFACMSISVCLPSTHSSLSEKYQRDINSTDQK